jgi:hypothetical protein
VPAHWNTLALVSLVSGVVAWFAVPFVGGIVAVVSGHLARGQIGQSGEQGGTLAIVGLVLGYLHLAVLLLLVVLFLLIVFGLDSAKLVTP